MSTAAKIGLSIALLAGISLAVARVRAGDAESSRENSASREVLLTETIALINGEPLTRGEWERLCSRAEAELEARAQVIGYEVERLWRARLEAFNDAVLEHLLTTEAAKQGLSISEPELRDRARDIAEQHLNQIKHQVPKEALGSALAQIAGQADGTVQGPVGEEDFLRWATEQLIADHGDELRASLTTAALMEHVTGSVTATEEEVLASYDEVRLREILVATHPPGQPARSAERARARADELLAAARGGADFAELARTESDEQERGSRRGLRDPVPVPELPPPYRKALGARQSGELLPDPIATDKGYLIVKVEQREQRTPKDFEEKKQQYLDDFVARKREAVWREYTEQLREKAEVEVLDPEILAYQALAERDSDRALPLLRRAAPIAEQIGGGAFVSVFYKLGTAAAARNEWSEAASAYATTLDALAEQESQGESVPAEARVQPLLGLGLCYENLGKKDEATKWYRAASDATGVPSLHEHLMLVYRRMGREELAAKEQAWLDEYRKQEAEREQGLRERRTPDG